MTDRDERVGRGAPPNPRAEGAGVSGGEVLGGSLGEELGSGAAPVVGHPEGYLRTLLLLLLAATFFEGYDGAILGLVLPDIRDTFNVTESQLGVSRALIELGLGGAFFLARAGDRWGRRTLLLWSVLGYTVMTALTAASWDLWSFTAFQSLSRVFIGAEYAVAVTMIVEEFPKDRRARVLGLFLMCSAVGAVAVALFLIAGVADGPLEWRTLYLVGLIPLVFLAVFRRGVRETQRFQDHAATVRSGGGELRVNFWEPWRPEYRRTLVLVGLVHLFRSLPLFGATAWFFYYAEREIGMDETLLYVIFIAAYGFGTLGYWVCGNLMDRVGRRPTAILYGVLAAFSSFGLFQARSPAAVGVLMVMAVFFGLGMAPVAGAISTELFPTYIRNQSAAWARNVFEIAGFILGPLLVGVLGDHYTGALGSVGDAVSILVLLFVPATFLIWRHLPETKGRELEEIERELGISTVRSTPIEPGRRSRTQVWVFASVAALVIGGTIGVGVVALGRFTERPEGAAERFLQAVDSGERDALVRYGSPGVAEELFGTTAVEFSQIEIGAAVPIAHLRVVPFRVVLDDADRAVAMSLTTQRRAGDWKVTGFAPRGPITQLRVPSEGGPAPAGAPAAAWILALLSVGLVTVAAEMVLRALRSSVTTVGKHRRDAPR